MNDASSPDIESLLAALYSAFDNRGPRPPATAGLRDMFVAGGRIAKVSGERAESWSVEEFIVSRTTMLTDGTLTEFHEWETAGETTVFGNIANRTSHYRKTGTRDGVAFAGEGRKFIQLCRAGGRWVIASVLWEDV